MTTILKPGFLVALKTTLHGGVAYQRRDLDVAPDEAAAEVVRWETTRVIDDPKEHEVAVKARGAAASKIRACCVPTSFGLLCPESNEPDLDAAIREARQLADGFNATSKLAKIGIYALKGKIAQTDQEAARAVAAEVTGLLDDMQAGIRDVDVAKVREAANKARALGAVLDARQAEVVSRAVETARKAAREIVKRVEKGGEDAAIVLESIATKPIESARFAFLDLDAPEPAAEGSVMPAIEVVRFAEVN